MLSQRYLWHRFAFSEFREPYMLHTQQFPGLSFWELHDNQLNTDVDQLGEGWHEHGEHGHELLAHLNFQIRDDPSNTKSFCKSPLRSPAGDSDVSLQGPIKTGPDFGQL